MSVHAGKKRKSLLTMFSLRRPAHRAPDDTAPAHGLRAIQGDVVVTSPKVYESGLITRLDLRLVDLYGDCAIESRDTPRNASPHAPGY
jgi:hypothetical protein